MSNHAPIDKVFIITPPTRNEAPEGYITSECGRFHQRAISLRWNSVKIKLNPKEIGSNIIIRKGVLR